CPHVVVPRVHRSHSARRVLTMERLDGVHLDAYAAAETDPARRNETAAKLSELLWRMQVEIGMLHADPHPGNFLFLPDGRIGLLDFGCVKKFPDAFVRNYVTLLRKVLARDEDGILETYERMGFLTAQERAGAASSDRMREWLRWTYLCCTGLDEDRDFPDPARGESWGRFITELHDSLNRHVFKVGCYTPRDAVYLNRVTLGVMCFWKRLDARGNWHRIMLRHLEAAEARLGLLPSAPAPAAAGSPGVRAAR
ncbi:MAG TPA: AarF/UbiB family protein, partial [Planctomycetota bacterium]|nr:AarF/UbiB family protein [Planctomycetota bacterium]